MASNFIPMLSSSPPPLDDCPDNDDDDEEFGTFTSANIAFDSSFDSPVAGEKYKPFKTGENGINDIALKNDLNTFCPPAQNFKLSFTKQNLSSHKKNFTPNEIKDDDQFTPDLSNKFSSRRSQSSSSEELNVINKDSSVTSQNCLPGGVNDSVENSCNSPIENNRCKRKQFSTCSNEETVSQNESNSVHPRLDGCGDEVSKSLFVPPSSNKLETKNSEDVYIPGGDINDTFQSTDVDISKQQESLSHVSSVECSVEQSNHHKSEHLNVDVDSNEQYGSNYKNLNVDFPVDFSASDSFDEFDDFQGVDSANNTFVNSGDVLSKSMDNNEESFEAHFDDFQQFESEHDSKLSKFADFQTDEKGYSSDADEFDDFQSFGKISNEPISKREIENCKGTEKILESNHAQWVMPESTVLDDELEEDFDDFQACAEVGTSSEEGFAKFEADTFKTKSEAESSEFADFEGASFSSASGETFPNSPCLSSSSHNQEKSVDKLSTVMNAIFPLQEEEPHDEDIHYDPASEILEQSNKSRRLWEKLHEVEQTPGLRFQWGVSHSFQQLLRSVNVDYHSILRTSSVPIFASGLSLLEPVKGQTSSANPESEDRIQSPRDPIPPVEFDWNSSGLTNPLDSVQAASTLMDLSFLSPSDTATSTVVGDHSFENELLKPSPIPALSETTSKTFILEELLSKNVCSIPNSNLTHRPSNLSEEANCVLDQLPDLTFMRAKVLMFPISSKT